MKKTSFMPTVILSSICIVAALLLSLVNLITGPIIEAAQNAAANEALTVVLPDGKNFEELTLDESYPATVISGYKADGGYVFQVTVTGKSAGLTIMCGIDTEGKIVGTQVIATNETPGYASQVFPEVEGTSGKYTGTTLETLTPYIVAGATLTSSAYADAMKAALQAYVIASGGSVDIRTPEQILQDNCNAALGTDGITFTKWFAVAALDGVDAVYEASDKSGRVYVIGETFIGIKADGSVATADADASAIAKATAADTLIGAITYTDVEKPDAATDKNASIVSIKMASNGAYVIELLADGYQATFDYGDGTQIEIKIAIDKDGKIIDVVTLSHNESKGYGSNCATDEYYEQYKGKGDSDITVSAKYPVDYHDDLISPDNTDVGAIASATYTTVGYQKAVKLAFKAFELLTAEEGGNVNE